MIDYHERKETSASWLKAIDTKGPRYVYENYISGISEPTDAMVLGTRVHMATLEPVRFDSNYEPVDGTRRSKEYKSYDGPKVPLPRQEYDHIMRIRDAVMENEHAARLVESGKAEVETFKRVKFPGVGSENCKAKADLLNIDWVADLKTTRRPDPRGWSYEVRDLAYDIQAFWYMTLFGVDTFYFIIVSNSAPYHCWVQRVDAGSEMYNTGKERALRALRKLQQCRETNDWRNWYEREVQVAE